MKTVEKTAIPIKPATSNEKTIPQRKDNNLAEKKQTAATSSTSSKPTYSESVAGSSKNTIITNKQLSSALIEIDSENKCLEYIELASDERKPKPGGSEEWKTIQRRKPRGQVVIGNNTSIQVNGRHMKGVPKLIDIHVSRVDPSMSAEDLKEFVKLNFPEAQCSALRSKYPDKYSSFKITSNAESRGFRFSTEKTQCVHFCRLRIPHDNPQLNLNGQIIQCKDEIQMLGMTFDKKLYDNNYLYQTQYEIFFIPQMKPQQLNTSDKHAY
ncbi:hypothetical protein JTB14_036514 [Gonioctena quinquepunctata]|nr:hypothetical protein JTB14_036514 [Gonioctena quinquepunctata]